MSDFHSAPVAVTAESSAKAPSILREYYELTKPGITQMVALTTLTGYYLAIPTNVVEYSSLPSNLLHFAATITGTVLISSGSCVANHILERDADARMKRTASRPLPAGTISVRSATWFAAILSLGGGGVLSMTNMLTVLLAVATWLTYVVVYTPLKKHSRTALLVGGIPGALPFAGGWTAVSATFDAGALALFAILFLWQMPHFLALSWMYRIDYREGGFAMHATIDRKGEGVAHSMIVYSLLLVAALLLPTILGITGTVYAIAASALGLWLVAETIRFRTKRDTPSARRVLLTSYAVLMGALITMVTDKVPLP